MERPSSFASRIAFQRRGAVGSARGPPVGGHPWGFRVGQVGGTAVPRAVRL